MQTSLAGNYGAYRITTGAIKAVAKFSETLVPGTSFTQHQPPQYEDIGAESRGMHGKQ